MKLNWKLFILVTFIILSVCKRKDDFPDIFIHEFRCHADKPPPNEYDYGSELVSLNYFYDSVETYFYFDT